MSSQPYASHWGAQERIASLAQLGYLIQGFLLRLGLTQGIKDAFFGAMRGTVQHNPWFTEHHVRTALQAIATDMLGQAKLTAWLAAYPTLPVAQPKRVGIIMAGNLPLVGFHDLLCVLLSGHQAVVKLSSKDAQLLPMLMQLLEQINHRWQGQVVCGTQSLPAQDIDALIATGSNNTSHYFAYHYSGLPHIFRGHRRSIALLQGAETPQQLQGLVQDVLLYSGLGCRNVSTLYVPMDYSLEPLQALFEAHAQHMLKHPYFAAAYRYAKAVCQMHGRVCTDMQCCLAIEDADLSPRVAELQVLRYTSLAAAVQSIEANAHHLQCVVGAQPLEGLQALHVPFGQSQHPALTQYADGVDVMQFLQQL